MCDEEEKRLNGRKREREICYVTNEDEDNDGDDEDEGMLGESKWKYWLLFHNVPIMFIMNHDNKEAQTRKTQVCHSDDKIRLY